MNKISLIGRLTKDPELKYSSSGKAFVRFKIAVSRGGKQEEGKQNADFINCYAWENKAEAIAKYVKKGHRFGVIGALRTSSYDKEDGTKGYMTEVQVQEMEFLENKSKEEQPEPFEPTKYQGAEDLQKTSNEVDDPFADFGQEVVLTDDMLPF